MKPSPDSFIAFSDPIRNNQSLRDLASFKTFAPKTVILNEKDQGGSVYFILDGVVKVTSYSAKGREIWYTKLSDGHIFGEMAALTKGTRTASIVAVEETTTAIISKANFLSVLQNDSDVSMWLLQVLASRLDETSTRLYERVALNITTRICTRLLEYCEGDANRDGEYPITPPLVLAQLARQLNTDRENISRAISDLVRDNILRRDGKTLIVTNYEALLNHSEI